MSHSPVHLSTNVYPWFTFYARENRRFQDELSTGLQEVAESGLNGFEPAVENPDELDRLLPLLKERGLEMRSLYVGSSLHEPEAADLSLARILRIAEKAKAFGATILVTNPNPIRWGTEAGKSDEQLNCQADALNTLGRRLSRLEMTLAYHHHDAELHHAAREFHHMMVGTDPEAVTLCLDTHWVYRGAGNSSVALFDIVRLYGSRISELHLRQGIISI